MFRKCAIKMLKRPKCAWNYAKMLVFGAQSAPNTDPKAYQDFQLSPDPLDSFSCLLSLLVRFERKAKMKLKTKVSLFPHQTHSECLRRKKPKKDIRKPPRAAAAVIINLWQITLRPSPDPMAQSRPCFRVVRCLPRIRSTLANKHRLRNLMV